MARTRQEIKDGLTNSFMSNTIIRQAYGFPDDVKVIFKDAFSIVSFENTLFDIIAYAIFLLEQLFDAHKVETEEMIYTQKSGRLPWYRTMALKFQYGFDLLTDSDYFDNGDATSEEVENSKIIKYAAVNEGDRNGVIVIKIAGEDEDGKLKPLEAVEQESVETYFDEIRYAGTRVNIINHLPDKLDLHVDIERDALLIDENGVNKLTGEKPVELALEAFMKELPFNGELILAHLVDKLQAIEGVHIPTLHAAYSSWINPDTGDYGVPTQIDIKRIPESGYFELTGFENINYVV